MEIGVGASVVIFIRHSSSALACIQREGKGAGWHLTPSHRYLHVIITFLSTSPIVNTIKYNCIHYTTAAFIVGTNLYQSKMAASEHANSNLCNKSWNAGCDELSLSDHRLYLKFSYVLLLHQLVSLRKTRSHIINRPYMLTQPFASTNSYFYSFCTTSF